MTASQWTTTAHNRDDLFFVMRDAPHASASAFAVVGEENAADLAGRLTMLDECIEITARQNTLRRAIYTLLVNATGSTLPDDEQGASIKHMILELTAQRDVAREQATTLQQQVDERLQAIGKRQAEVDFALHELKTRVDYYALPRVYVQPVADAITVNGTNERQQSLRDHFLRLLGIEPKRSE